MKKIIKKYQKNLMFFILLSVITFVISCNDTEKENNSEKKEYSGKAKIEFYKIAHDFGTLKEGEVVECTFKYKNIGDAPLKLLYVDADCGCTVPEYDKGEILPGEEGRIKAVFDSDGFMNNIYKTIDVETNADSTITELVITAFIERKINY
ncbi:MAG: DUF1573 domain-containing protein [Bacteroidales bacterium]|nr:DUF1573 domain-containing protein [Bacteroidales bacterium]